MSKNPPPVTVKPELKPVVLELADKLKKHLEVDKKTGTIGVAANTYAELLPEGITAETIKKINEHNGVLAAAGAVVVGQIGIEVMKKNKSVDRVEAVIPMVGKDSMSFNFQRSRPVNVPGQNGEPNSTKTVYGSMQVQIDLYAEKPRGDLRKARELLALEAAAAFGG